MKYRTFFVSLCLSAALLATPAMAEEAKPMGEHHGNWCESHNSFTLEQMREHTKKKLEELNAMTPQQWEVKRKERLQRCEARRARHEKKDAISTSVQAPEKK